MLTPAGARALSQRGPASPPSLSRHRRPRGWGFGSRCGGEEKRRRGPGAEPLAGPSSQEMRRIKGKKLEKAHQSNTERSGTREGRRGGTKRGTLPWRGALTEVAGRPSSTVISRGGRRPPKIIQIHKGSGVLAGGRGWRGGEPGRRLGPTGGGRRLVRRARRSARPGPGPSSGRSGRRSAAPGAQAPGPAGRPGSAKGAESTAAAAPGSLRPAGGAFQAGGRAPRPGPGGGVAVSAERNRARGPTVLKKKSKNRPERAPRAALGRLPGLGAPAPLKWAARVSAAVTYAPATSRGRDGRLGSGGSAGAAARAET